MPMMTSEYWNSSLYVTIGQAPLSWDQRAKKLPSVKRANRLPLLAALKDNSFLLPAYHSRRQNATEKEGNYEGCRNLRPVQLRQAGRGQHRRPGPGLPGVRRQQGLCCPGGVRRRGSQREGLQDGQPESLPEAVAGREQGPVRYHPDPQVWPGGPQPGGTCQPGKEAERPGRGADRRGPGLRL